MNSNDTLLTGLRKALGADATAVDLIETHISWVLLAGEWAYKMKKPVNYDFLDFSTLEKRRHFCEEELRLNRRFSPHLYIAVVAITAGADGLEIDGSGEVREYAVKMKRFPQEALMSSIADRGELTPEMADAVARELVRIHKECPRAGADSGFGRPEDIAFWVNDNFIELRSRLKSADRQEALDGIETWCRAQDEQLATLLAGRRHDGFVRETHGDLHLRNIAWLNGGPVFFDCIEFNEALRWIDVMSEVAFAVMDLEDRGFATLAHRFLNRYLEANGDYEGLAVLRYYLVYRAMVRAKVAILREEEGEMSAGEDAALWKEYDAYLDLARRYKEPEPPTIIILHGLAGAGKSTLARRLVETMGAVQVRSDVERKRLFGMEAGERSDSAVEDGIYSIGAGEATYARLAECAEVIVRSGWTAIVDATFLRRGDRERFHQLEDELGVPLVIVEVTAPLEVLEERIRRREAEGTDPSEAGMEVLHRQMETIEALAGWELEQRVAVSATMPMEIETLVRGIQERKKVPGQTI